MSSTHQAIYGLRKELGLDDDTARDFYAREVGKRSLREMSVGEQVQVMQALQREVRGGGTASGRKLDGPYAGKLQALWIAGWNLGIFAERDDSALVAFVKRQTGLDAVQFVRYPDDAKKAIEALKAIITREGKVDWRIGATVAPHKRAFGYRIARAQWALLEETGHFLRFAHAIAGRDLSRMLTDDEWIVVMNELGRRIRAKAVA